MANDVGEGVEAGREEGRKESGGDVGADMCGCGERERMRGSPYLCSPVGGVSDVHLRLS